MDITDFMGSKAKGTDNPIGLNFRMCAFHRFFVYFYSICTCAVLGLLAYYSGFLSGAKEKMAVYTLPLTKSKSDSYIQNTVGYYVFERVIPGTHSITNDLT